jgi:DNA-binding transcriptional LysR family regulator
MHTPNKASGGGGPLPGPSGPPTPADFDLNLLRVLAALLREGSATRAARALDLSQSAVSHALGRLRGTLGDPLFVRAGKGLRPTPRAAAFAERLPALLGELGALLAADQDFDPQSSERRFCVAATDYGQLVLLPGLLARLGEQAPGVRLEVRQLERSVVAALEDGEVELALGNFRQVPAALRRQALFDERFVCLLREGHPRVGSRLSLKAYLELSHVLVAPMGYRGSVVDDLLVERGAEPRRVALTVPHFLVAPFIVAASDLVLTVPERVARRYASALPLRRLAPPLEVPGFTISQLWHERMHHDAGHAFLRAAIAAELRRR